MAPWCEHGMGGAQRRRGYRGGGMEATAMRLGDPLREHGQHDRGGDGGSAMREASRNFFPSNCPLAAIAYHRKMATLDGLVRGRGDPSFSLTISLSNPTTWMELKRVEG
uniref:Uncharacterized protein n=1 Tax=Oryza barthii TaxID=65489 RepID=A0A0D3GY24_9ORYZ